MARILVVSPGHSPQRSDRQPWAYLEGIAAALGEHGHETVLVGDGPAADGERDTQGVTFHRVASVRSRSAVEAVAATQEPDVCLWSLGPATSVYHGTGIPRVAPTMGAVVPGPLYSPAEVTTQLSTDGLGTIRSSVSLVASAFVPQTWFRRFLRRHFDHVVAPTETIVEATVGSSEDATGLTVPHGLNSGLLASTWQSDGAAQRSAPTPPADPYVLNFGPPRSIRGVTDFVDAVLALRARGIEVRGVVLARIDDADDRAALSTLEQRLRDGQNQGAFQIVDQYLKPADRRRYITQARAVALPYRLVQSTVPISIIEALGLGRPVVTTDIDGAREVVPDREWMVPPGDGEWLASALEPFFTGKDTCQADHERSSHIPSWEESIRPLRKVIETSARGTQR